MPDEPAVGSTPDPDPDPEASPEDEDSRAVPTPHEIGDENAQPG